MNEIKCPHCGTVFQIAESDYESIVSQIRDKEFHKELERIETQHKKEQESALEISRVSFEKKLAEELNEKNVELQKLQSALEKSEVETKNKIETEYLEKLKQKELEIHGLKSEIQNREEQLTILLKKSI